MEKRDLLPRKYRFLAELKQWRNQESQAKGMKTYNLGSNEDYIDGILAYPSTTEQQFPQELLK